MTYIRYEQFVMLRMMLIAMSSCFMTKLIIMVFCHVSCHASVFMTNIFVTKLPRGNGSTLYLMTFLSLVYDDLECHRFYDEYIFCHYIYDVFLPFVIKLPLTRTFCDDGLFVMESSQQQRI
jgi:hypothetical protein